MKKIILIVMLLVILCLTVSVVAQWQINRQYADPMIGQPVFQPSGSGAVQVTVTYADGSRQKTSIDHVRIDDVLYEIDRQDAHVTETVQHTNKKVFLLGIWEAKDVRTTLSRVEFAYIDL